jgi:hypothetical protein
MNHFIAGEAVPHLKSTKSRNVKARCRQVFLTYMYLKNVRRRVETSEANQDVSALTRQNTHGYLID